MFSNGITNFLFTVTCSNCTSKTFSAKRRNLYNLCGKLLAISLCNGGGVGHCLAQCMYDFFVRGENKCNPGIDDVHDVTIKDVLQQVGININLFLSIRSILRLFCRRVYTQFGQLSPKPQFRLFVSPFHILY